MAITATVDEEELDRLYTNVARGGPVYETAIVGNPKAIQQRSINRYDAVRVFEIEYGGMSQAERLKLETFFLTKWGRAIGFRFFPPTDRDFRNDIIGVGDGVNTTFYMKRNYASAHRFISRRIVKPVRHTVVITLDGSKVPYDDPELGEFYPEGDYPEYYNPVTIDWSQGTVGFPTPPGVGVLVRCAEGQYDLPVHFDTDAFHADDYGAFADWNSVRVTEILPTALGVAGNDEPALTLAFATPYVHQEAEDEVDVSFTAGNVTKVFLYVDGVLHGSTTTGPTFAFANVPVPANPGGTFLMEAVGTNALEQIVVASMEVPIVGEVIDGGSSGSSEWIIDGGGS